MRILPLVSFLAACSGGSCPTADPLPERTDLIRRGTGGPLTVVGKTLDVGDAMPDAEPDYDALLAAAKRAAGA